MYICVCVVIHVNVTYVYLIIYKQNTNLKCSHETLNNYDTNVFHQWCAISTSLRKDTGVFKSFDRLYFCVLLD